MPKLYYSVQRASDPALADPWQVPGQQDKKAERVDVPAAPAELAAWLNSRRVPLAGDAFDGLVPANEAARELLAGLRAPGTAGEQTGAVLTSADVDRVNASRPSFMPRLDADEIERRRIAMRQCPKCGGSRAERTLTVGDFLAWIDGAPMDELQEIAHAIKERAKADREALAGGLQ
jgi:hypothetical protein